MTGIWNSKDIKAFLASDILPNERPQFFIVSIPVAIIDCAGIQTHD